MSEKSVKRESAKVPERVYGVGHKLIGKDYPTPDLYAKVTGLAKYAEDYHADGMLFCKLLLSPLPHARVKHLDTRAALAMPGVKAILVADELPPPADSLTDNGTVIKANPKSERALTMEPLYQGEPILAVAAVDEFTAAEAIEKIRIDFEPLPFVIDPLETLRPGGPNPRLEGNIWVQTSASAAAGGGPPPSPPTIGELKWTKEDFATAKEGQLPMGKTPGEWSYGDLDAAFKNAALVLDETFVTPDTSHQTLETRTAMAYWQNGKVHVYTGTQSTAQTVPAIARWLNTDPGNVVLISEYTGGGFGSKVTAGVTLIIPALLSKKVDAPVMMRISREEETFIGRARPSLMGRMKAGFSKDGRVLALDMFVISNNGPYDANGDAPSSGRIVSLLYQCEAMRWRGATILTNTPPRSAQSSPGGMQGIAIMEPLIAKAARKLGLDQVAIRRINCPEGKAPVGPVMPSGGKRPHATSAFLKEALDRGAEQFKWNERVARTPKRRGTKVRGVGVALSCYAGGTVGFDGLLVITPEGRVRFHSGIGNLGTESVMDVHRAGAEVLGVPWEKCDITWGDTTKNLPFTCVSGGSQTTHAMTRAAYATAMDAKRKLQEIAAKSLGGKPENYEVANERVFRKGGGASMTLAQAAAKAIRLGGIYDGHEPSADLNKLTKASMVALAGQGLVVAAKDNYPRDGQTYSYVASFAEVEVDIETGKYYIVDFLAYADVGSVIHPRALGGQVLGRSVLGIGHAIGQKWVYDPQYGAMLSTRFYENKPPTILDVPVNMQWAAVDIPDPETPVGARGVGEPPVGGGCASILNALSDALGDDIFRRAPVNADTILTSLEAGRPMQHPLMAHI
jgi:xanthine dehydrogenase molybdenum-binding subunit